MTLHIIHSNKVENLHDELCYLLKNQPLANPFDIETIVSPSKAMARWMHIRFTQKMGIAAHYEYPMPASWVWQLAGLCLNNVPEQDPLQRDSLAWKIFYFLEDIENNDVFNPLINYLLNDTNTTKRWSLAKKIAFVFERYQYFRPDLIQQWDDGPSSQEDWQGVLWKNITADLDTNRVQLLTQLGRRLSSDNTQQNLPQRLIFFSVSALPPLLFKNIQALARHTEIYFFVLSPSAHYWSDLVSLKRQAKQRLKSPELNDYFITGHELLASWGRQGQIFQDMLLDELDDALSQQHDVYDAEFDRCLLNQLQKSLFNLNDDTINCNADDSIRFNLCHSPLRECEIVHDQCLALLEGNDISPEDILVIVPNMELYAVNIEAVFKKTPDQHRVKPFIPWNLSDSSLHAEDPLIRTFLNALSLPNSRASVSDILSYLDCPQLLRHFKLQQSDKKIIREYIHQAHIHWGFDAAHKADFDVPEMLQSTWQHAQQRFFSFYSVAEKTEYNTIIPLLGFSGSRALVIAQFMHLLESLNNWRKKLAHPRSATQWQLALNQIIDGLFDTAEEDSIQVIRDAIDELVTQSTGAQANGGQHINLHRELLTRWLNDYFSNNQSNQRFFSGGITFCGMRPMRSVPFKVIVMLGMNEHEFPRHNNPIEFDLMASQWRPGDLLMSDEDRYLFLEAILCARKHLIISYCANSLKDNSVKEPSNLVTELWDYLDTFFIDKHDDKAFISKQLSTQYAMHAFSQQNYSEGYQSYNHFWRNVALQLHVNSPENSHEQARQVAYKDGLELSDEIELSGEIELKRLINSLKDPVKYYFNTQLNIRLYDERENDDDEPFDLDALQQWSLKNHLINAHITQQPSSISKLLGQALLPHGAHAQACFEGLENELEEQLEAVQSYLNLTPQSIDLSLLIDDKVTLKGQINNYYPNLGQLLLTPSKFGSKPFIECWIKHCALCAIEQLKAPESSVLSCQDKTLRFTAISKNMAQQFLLNALLIMHHAASDALTILPKASFFYQYFVLIKDEHKAQAEALARWNGNPKNAASLGEKEDDFIALAFKQFYADPSALFNSTAFKEQAHSMYADAFAHCHFDAGLD